MEDFVMDYTNNLIEAMINYGENACWCDSEIIETLIDCGITEQDFIDCGYGEYTKEYFKNN